MNYVLVPADKAANKLMLKLFDDCIMLILLNVNLLPLMHITAASLNGIVVVDEHAWLSYKPAFWCQN